MTRRVHATLLGVFVLSGAAGLIFEVVLQRELTRVFGVSAWATSTVLAAYMAGTAGGAALIGRWIDRVRRPLRVYAALELLLALCAALTHPAAALLMRVFAQLAHGQPSSSGGVAALRVVLAFLFCLPPTLVIGGTLPALAKGFSDQVVDRSASARGIALLYSANLLGATLGTLGVTYQLLPSFGLSKTLVVGACFNLACAGVVFLLDRRAPVAPPPPAEGSGEPLALAHRRVLAAAAWSGFATFAFEVVYTQLLAVVVGNSAYAFGLMLTIFLAGLTLGSLLAQRAGASFRVLGTVLVLSTVAVAITLPMWDQLPSVFSAARGWADTFGRRELVRAAVCVAGILGPATLLGAFYPLLLRWAAQESAVGKAVGGVASANTLGCMAGALMGGFVLLPVLGTRGAIELLGAANCLVAAICYRGKAGWQLGALGVAAALLAIPGWSYERLSSGANVYFQRMAWSGLPIVFARESVQAGLTTVARAPNGALFLLSNGKFQGSTTGERTAQYRFAQTPMALEHGMKRGLVIGVGTGATTAAMAGSPLEQIEVAELSADMVEAAEIYFQPLNLGLLTSPRVDLHLADGRNLLLLSDRKYDVITLEITSIWIAGEADLYNREFYALAGAHLAPHGILQQWVQLHHMSRRDLALILQSARAELPHVALFFGGGQGQLVASREPLAVDYAATLERSRHSRPPALNGLAGHDLLTTAGELLLDEAGVDRLIEDEARAEGVPAAALVSTDDNLRLEYDTPRANLIEGSALIDQLRAFPAGALPVVNADTPGARDHAEGARLIGRLAHASPQARGELLSQAQARLQAAVAQGATEAASLLNALNAELAKEQPGSAAR